MISRVPRQIVGQHQVAHQKAPPGHALLIHDQIAHLAVHFLDGLAGHSG